MEKVFVTNDETERHRGTGVTESELQVREAAEFRRGRRYKGKLHDHQELIKALLDHGFSSYMVWRYLVEKVGVTVSNNTVYRFIHALRSPMGVFKRSLTIIDDLYGSNERPNRVD